MTKANIVFVMDIRQRLQPIEIICTQRTTGVRESLLRRPMRMRGIQYANDSSVVITDHGHSRDVSHNVNAEIRLSAIAYDIAQAHKSLATCITQCTQTR